MKATHLIVTASLGAFALGGCAETTTMSEPAEPAAAEAAGGDCAVLAHRNWTAHINAMPGPDAQRTLNVAGEVDLPTPGYTVTLDLGPADRSATPVQQLIVNTTAPTGVVAQVVTPYPVSYAGPAIAETYRGVRIMCGGEQLAEVDVTVAQ